MCISHVVGVIEYSARILGMAAQNFILAAQIAIACVASALSNPSYAAADEDALKALNQEIGRIKSLLPQVWRENVIPSVEFAFPNDSRVRALRSWTIEIDNDPCNLLVKVMPKTDRLDQGGSIVVGHSMFILSMYLSQAYLLELMEPGDLTGTPKSVRYAQEEVRRAYSILERSLRTKEADCGNEILNLKSYLAFRGVDEVDYGRIMADLTRDQKSRKTADYVGGLTLFFFALHEAGHVWNEDFGSRAASDEDAADQFAIDVIEANQLPPTLAAVTLLMLAEVPRSPRPEPDEALHARCRLFSLAERGGTIDPSVYDDRAVASLRPKLEAFVAYWITSLRDHCRN